MTKRATSDLDLCSFVFSSRPILASFVSAVKNCEMSVDVQVRSCRSHLLISPLVSRRFAFPLLSHVCPSFVKILRSCDLGGPTWRIEVARFSRRAAESIDSREGGAGEYGTLSKEVNLHLNIIFDCATPPPPRFFLFATVPKLSSTPPVPLLSRMVDCSGHRRRPTRTII